MESQKRGRQGGKKKRSKKNVSTKKTEGEHLRETGGERGGEPHNGSKGKMPLSK